MDNSKKKQILFIGVSFFVGIILVYFLMYILQGASQDHVLQDTFTLKTTPLQKLQPHGHILGVDSMGDQGHHVRIFSDPVLVEEDMWVTATHFQLYGAPPLVLHHGTVFRLDERDLECPTESFRPLVSVSQDQVHTNAAFFPDGYGVFIPKGTLLQLEGMFHNPEPPIGPGETYTDVSLEVSFTLAKDTKEMKPLTYHLLRLSDTPCREYSHTFVVPPSAEAYLFAGTNEENDASKLVIEKDSKIVYWGAHLHGWEGGERLTVRKDEEVVEVFETQKIEGDPYGYATPHGNRDITLHEGDTLSIEAVYTNTTSEQLRGAMGHLGLYIAEE